MTTDGFNDAVAAVTRFLVADAPLGDTLARIARLATDAVGPAVALGLTLYDDRGQPSTQVFTDDVSPLVDQGQYDDGEGPSLLAHRTGEVVLVPDLTTVTDRWPSFARLALENGLSSTLSVPLVANQVKVGVMTMYASRGRSFTEQDAQDVSRFAVQAAIVLANTRSYWTTHDLTVGLQAALDSRAMIDMAKGKLMALNDISPDEAFALLVRASQRENIKVRDIARRIVEGSRDGAEGGPAP
ncbi:MAG: hypothetical protein QOD70_2482 [Frankiales bacterium]|nr:hypothetical protein [Frankiales bacterium]